MSILNVPWSSRALARGQLASRAAPVYAPALAFLFVSSQVLALAGERFALPRL